MSDQPNPLFIDGTWRPARGVYFTSENPCTGELIWRAHAADENDVLLATEAAAAAFPAWAQQHFEARAAIVERFKQILITQQEELSSAIALETGKPLWEARTEVAAMQGKIAISIDAYQKRTGEALSENAGAHTIVRHKPHGVIAVFGPFNFPGHLPNGHIIPALLAGNTIVFKPSEMTPYVAQLTAQYWQQAGLPSGVLNLVQGEKATGIALARQPLLNGLFFTGSFNTGAHLHRQFAGDPSRILALEMGGNNPLLVFDTANIDAAVYYTVQSAYLSAGQRCTCARRLIIPDNEAGIAFTERLQQIIKHIKVGSPLTEPAPFMGPVIANHVANQLLQIQAQLIEQGAQALCPMMRIQNERPFLTPGLLDVTAVATLPDEEYFGPLLQLIRVKDFEQALQVANQTRYGLAAGLLSDKRSYWEQFYALSHAGIVNWNRPLTGASSAAPFGGIGASGNHRPSAYYAADYSAYPVASLTAEQLTLPTQLTPGITL